ncbi:MFS domain-containing protein [Mycena chlorophos]|uniref:MFS domain-containing protein n=1 Tax=Mycena chlorophos TaxID=658473 RepID=A0A8H6TMC7_MYCCL|nr:MFS domain-containing protein [Mycena chlorophos]
MSLSSTKSSSLPATVQSQQPMEQDGTGTKHQNRVRLTGRFTRPSKDYAEAVSWDAETVVYTKDEENAVRRKLDRVILPLVALGTICKWSILPHAAQTHTLVLVGNQLDRTNVGNAHVLTRFNENYDLASNEKWTVALGVFYLSYTLFQIPTSVIQRRIGGNRFYFVIAALWGASSISMAFARGYTSLILLRLLLGVGEGGFNGMLYYLTFFYKRDELAKRYGLALNFALPGSVGGLLAFGLVRLRTSRLAGWQFLFLAEGIPTALLSFAFLILLPSFPFSAWFLSPRERAIAHARLQRDQKPQTEGGPLPWSAFKAVIKDLNVWLLLVAYASRTVSMSYFLPTVIKNLGFNPITTQGLTAAPYAAAFVVNLIQTAHSDKSRQRGFHMMLAAALSFTGYTILLVAVSASGGGMRDASAARYGYFALFLVVIGNSSLVPLVFAWTANTLAPTSKRGIGIAFLFSSNILSAFVPMPT